MGVKTSLMSDYKFYASYLRFVAKKTTLDTPEIGGMMAELNHIAKILENDTTFTIEKNKLRITARAFAGVAGFLQQQILPEIKESKNITGEIQTRWVIDTSMELMSNIIVHAELKSETEDFVAILPDPPAIEG